MIFISTRYFILLLESKEECKDVLNKISLFLKDELNLELNNRTKYYPNKFGIDFCGYRIYETHILIRKRCKKKIRNNINKRNKLAITKCLDIKKMDNSFKSIYGHIKHSNCYNLKKKIIDERRNILVKFYLG